jgi:hypothetical protein
MQERNCLGQPELYLEVDRFWSVLEAAQTVAAQKEPGSHRKAAKRALAGAIMFVSRAYGPALGAPFRELLTALDNLDDGTVDPIIQKPDIEQNPGNPSTVHIYRALLVAIMELHMMSGMKSGSAAAATAQETNRFRAAGQNRISWRQVTRWRSELRQAIAKGCGEDARQSEDGLRQYRDTLAAYKQLYPNDPAAAAREIATCLHRFGQE